MQCYDGGKRHALVRQACEQKAEGGIETIKKNSKDRTKFVMLKQAA
jgi:hypothetical protein